MFGEKFYERKSKIGYTSHSIQLTHSQIAGSSFSSSFSDPFDDPFFSDSSSMFGRGPSSSMFGRGASSMFGSGASSMFGSSMSRGFAEGVIDNDVSTDYLLHPFWCCHIQVNNKWFLPLQADNFNFGPVRQSSSSSFSSFSGSSGGLQANRKLIFLSTSALDLGALIYCQEQVAVWALACGLDQTVGPTESPRPQ